jgi:PAS domain S-box-containing protein
MGDMMRGILGRHYEENERLHLQLFDGGEPSPQTLLYASHPGEHKEPLPPDRVTRQLQVNGRLWTLSFTQAKGGVFSAPYLVAWLTLAGGGVITLLLFSLVRSLLNTRRQAEALARTRTRELRQSEEKVSLILNTVGEAVYGINTDGCCTFCNRAALHLLGYTLEELLGKNMHELIHHSHEDGAPYDVNSCPIFKAFREDTGCHVVDEPFWRADGASFPVEYWSVPQHQDGLIVGAVVTFLDISERIKSAAEIRDAREYAENIVETVRESLLVLDAELKIVTANQSFYATFRVTPEETVGNFIYDLGSRQWDIPALRTLLENILPHETQFNGYEVAHEFPDIGRKIILLNARRIFREKIGSHLILLAMEDITLHKELQVELLLKDQEKINSLIRLAAGIAHELNNPLSFISSNLRVLTDYFD